MVVLASIYLRVMAKFANRLGRRISPFRHSE